MEFLRESLQKIRVEVGRFMLGRNGMDQLNYALLWGYLIVCVLRAIVVAVLRSVLFGRMFDLLLWILAGVIFFRVLSRNLSRRQEENRRWLGWWRHARRIGSDTIRRHTDRQHKYFTCKSCGTVCRVPKGKGNIVITCPRCGAKIQAKT